MRELEKVLKDLQKRGYELVDIVQVLNWMSDIRRERRIKGIETKERASKE